MTEDPGLELKQLVINRLVDGTKIIYSDNKM